MPIDLDIQEEFIDNVYSYVITDLRDNSIISELPFTGVSYEKNVSKAGTADLSLIIDDETLELNPNGFTFPGRTGIYIYRNQQVMWGGIIFKRQYDSDNRTLRITCKSFEEYFYHVLQRTNINVTNTEQIDIARKIISNNTANKDVKIDVDSTTMSGVKRERNMYAYEFKTVGEELEKLSALLKGFDWNVEIYNEPTTKELKRLLSFYYPQKGRTEAQTDLLFEFPGIIRSFTISDDADTAANEVFGIGAGEGDSQLVKSAKDANQLTTNKYPRLQKTVSYKSVTEESTLQSHVDADLKKELSPITVCEVVLRGDGEGEHELGTYDVGDWARFRIDDPWLPTPLDRFYRITGYKVSVEDSSGLETVTLVLGDDNTDIADDSEV